MISHSPGFHCGAVLKLQIYLCASVELFQSHSRLLILLGVPKWNWLNITIVYLRNTARWNF
jgi:hypothetical protein